MSEEIKEFLNPEEKREYLKPLRSAGGLMLFLGVFSTVLSLASAPLILMFLPMAQSEALLNELTVILTAPVLIYTYYIGYRIFVKKYHPNTVELRPVKKNDLLYCIIVLVLSLAVIRVIWYLHINLLELLGYEMETSGESGAMTILYSVLLAPVFEEIVFRDYLLTLLKRYGKIAAILLSSFAFGLFHGTAEQSLPSAFIGIILALLALRFDSIVPSIILHVTTNAISMFVDINFEHEVLMPYLLIIAAITLLAFLIKNFRHLKKAPQGVRNALYLYGHSISFIAFTVLYLGLIVLQYLGITEVG